MLQALAELPKKNNVNTITANLIKPIFQTLNLLIQSLNIYLTASR